MFRTLLSGLPLALMLALPPTTALAQSNIVVLEDVAKVDILPGWRTKSGTHMAALRVRLAPGWKTYWRAPGDGGIPPRFDWDGSANLKAVQFHWPVPTVFAINGIQSIGYHDELILPIEITPTAAGKDISVRASVELGVCEEICLPMQVDLRADLVSDAADDPAIRASLSNQPATARSMGVSGATCVVDPITDGLRVTARVEMPDLGSEVAVLELPDKTIWISQSDMAREGGILSATADMVPANAAPFLLNRSDLRITVLGDDQAVEIQGCPAG
ncbi:MAG: protein-disulfide reductase DsbD domain-containing protein [Paracoccaceae bacterium]